MHGPVEIMTLLESVTGGAVKANRNPPGGITVRKPPRIIEIFKTRRGGIDNAKFDIIHIFRERIRHVDIMKTLMVCVQANQYRVEENIELCSYIPMPAVDVEFHIRIVPTLSHIGIYGHTEMPAKIIDSDHCYIIAYGTIDKMFYICFEEKIAPKSTVGFHWKVNGE